MGDLTDMLKNEEQDQFILSLQDTLADIFAKPHIFGLANVNINAAYFDLSFVFI